MRTKMVDTVKDSRNQAKCISKNLTCEINSKVLTTLSIHGMSLLQKQTIFRLPTYAASHLWAVCALCRRLSLRNEMNAKRSYWTPNPTKVEDRSLLIQVAWQIQRDKPLIYKSLTRLTIIPNNSLIIAQQILLITHLKGLQDKRLLTN